MANLNRSIQELVVVLREYLGRQQTDLLFKRIELALRKTGPLQQERRDIRARRAADEEELGRLQAVVAAFQTTEPQDSAKPEKENREEAAQTAMAEANIKRLKRRIAEADQHLAELDSELLQEERNIQRLEALIDQQIGQR
jgi:chromosome segregation ATPase